MASFNARTRSCLSAAWSRAAVPCTRARVHALMRKQAKRREEEGAHVAVSCSGFSVLVCWHRPCIASYSVDATDKNNNASVFFSELKERGAAPPAPPTIGGVGFFFLLRGLFLHKKNWLRSSFSCFYRAMRRSRSGWPALTHKPPQNHFEPPPKNQECPPYLMCGEY